MSITSPLSLISITMQLHRSDGYILLSYVAFKMILATVLCNALLLSPTLPCTPRYYIILHFSFSFFFCILIETLFWLIFQQISVKYLHTQLSNTYLGSMSPSEQQQHDLQIFLSSELFTFSFLRGGRVCLHLDGNAPCNLEGSLMSV